MTSRRSLPRKAWPAPSAARRVCAAAARPRRATCRPNGAAAYDEISLDVDLNAPSLAEVGRAVGALQHKPSLPMSGSLRLQARLTGSPKKPDAQVHLRAPKLRWGPTVAADGLAVDGTLH